MKIKVFIQGGYKIVNVMVHDDIKKISEKFVLSEYIL